MTSKRFTKLYLWGLASLVAIAMVLHRLETAVAIVAVTGSVVVLVVVTKVMVIVWF